jgi:hypothetical protein
MPIERAVLYKNASYFNYFNFSLYGSLTDRVQRNPRARGQNWLSVGFPISTTPPVSANGAALANHSASHDDRISEHFINNIASLGCFFGVGVDVLSQGNQRFP